MSESDLKTIILLIPIVFKGDTETEYPERIEYVTSHLDELMQTLPMEVMQELSDRFVADMADEARREEIYNML